jgi:hypothetical protein
MAVLGVDQRCCDVDSVADATGHGTVFGVEPVGAFDLLAVLVPVDSLQRVGDMDPFDNEDLAVLLDLTDRLRREVSVACIDATRLQRASQGAGQSATGRSNDIVERGRIRRIGVGIYAVMFGNFAVDAERDVLVSGGQPRIADRPPNPFDLYN